MAPRLRNFLGAALLSLMHLGEGQAQGTETVWSTLIFTSYGERTPLLLPGQDYTLTPLGAQQLLAAGSLFRERYIAPTASSASGTGSAINDISTYTIDSSQINVISPVDGYISASALAFMQGLYPPILNSSDNFILTGMSVLVSYLQLENNVQIAHELQANGSNIDYPLSGYQYPQLYTADELDPSLVWIAGDNNCPAYQNVETEYVQSSSFSQIESATSSFYSGLSDVLDGIISADSMSYLNAYDIYDYLQYSYIHNNTVEAVLPSSSLSRAQALASQYLFATNANTTEGSLSIIAGQTLAAEILGLFFNNVEATGSSDKLSLMFGSFEPMLAFFALTGLPSSYSNFYSMPSPGSSMVFELFSLNNTNEYPDASELNVRFLFRNGSDSGESLIAYPLFGRPPTEPTMLLMDFYDALSSVMVESIGEWCTVCKSDAVFCPFYLNELNSGSGGSSSSTSSHGNSKSFNPAIAGLIGAVLALVIAALLFALAMLLGGIRVHRVKNKHRSELNGFKGGEKLASDPDVSIIKGAEGPGATVVKGHERVGSWEMGDAIKQAEAGVQRPGTARTNTEGRNFDADETSIHRYVEGLQAEERV